MNPFAIKIIQEPRTIGFAVRFLFIDLAVILTANPEDWYLIYLRAFGTGVRGIFAQIWFCSVFLGQNSYLYSDLVRDEPGIHSEETEA